MKKICGLIVAAFFLSMLVGCNISGVSAGLDGGSGVGSGDSGTQVAMVHQPEPATMLLWGIGLFGLARRLRRK